VGLALAGRHASSVDVTYEESEVVIVGKCHGLRRQLIEQTPKEVSTVSEYGSQRKLWHVIIMVGSSWRYG
jgi:hypothetical protein